MTINELIQDASNVYRTKKYIVKQVVALEDDNLGNIIFCSYDTYFLRTKKLDKMYDQFFKHRENKDGKRLKSTMYSRIYII